MSERELQAEIVRSGTWLYGNQLSTDVWIVKQNFEYYYDPGFSDGTEELNSDGEAFQVVMARDGSKIALGPSRLSLDDAVKAAEEVIPSRIEWSNHVQQKLYGGRWYLLNPLSEV